MQDERPDLAHGLTAFALATLGWLLISALTTASLAHLLLDAPLEEALASPRMLALGALVQTTGLGVVALLLARSFLGGPRTVLGATGRLAPTTAAFVGGLTVGFLPGWLAERLQDVVPNAQTALSLLGPALQDGPVGDALLLVCTIGIVAPIAEEVAFRGFLWRLLAHHVPLGIVAAGTSAVFVLYHLDPIQTPALLPTALFFAFVRWRTGSLFPAIAAHVGNNAAALVMLLALDPDTPTPVPLTVALVGTVFSWTLVALLPTRSFDADVPLAPGPRSG